MGSTRHLELKKELIDAESAILRELGFIVHAEHAHKFVLYYIHVLFAKPCEFPAELAQKAWSYANDSYRSTHCVQFRPKVLACAAIYLAARVLGIRLPEDPPWWELFDCEKEQILTVAGGVLALYQLPKAKWVNVRGDGKGDPEAAKDKKEKESNGPQIEGAC